MIPEPVGTRVSQWGECPVWHDGRLFHVDIAGQALVAVEPESGREQVWPVGQRVGFVAPRASGGLVWGGDHGLYFLDITDGQSRLIAEPEPDKPDNRFNDGKCSPDGRLFAGTISLARKTGDAMLYRLDPDLSLARAFGPVTTSNGLAWSPDGRRCYYIDTPARDVKSFSYDPETGALADMKAAFGTTALMDASPDGMTIDAEGMLWIAFCHGGCVKRVDPADGRELAVIRVPAVETTSVCFGGDGLRDLYITTGVKGGVEELMGGRLFVVKNMPVPGLPVPAFAG